MFFINLQKASNNKGNILIAASALAWSVSLAVLVSPFAGRSATIVSSGDLIKAGQPAVYYYGVDGKRYVFPNDKTYKTWYSGFSGVKTVTDSELAAIIIGGNVTYRPGVKMVKITTDPKVYAVSSGGALRWITSEAVAAALYGADWSKNVEDIPDAFFTNYKIGNPINNLNDFDRGAETNSADTINRDKGISSFGDLVTDTPVQNEPQVPIQNEPVVPVSAQPVETVSGVPAIFFTDIQSGPNTGGQDNLGAFITIWGEGFGASRGSSKVTIGGAEVAKYVIWGKDNGVARGLDMIVVQPGPGIASGNIVVTVNGKSSNTLPFTIRSGNIYFVIPGAGNASDSNVGTYAAPWKTIYQPRKVMVAGDTVYIKGGTFRTSDPAHQGWDAVLLLEPEGDPNGTANAPIAYIGYPGVRPVIEGLGGMRRGIYFDNGVNYYVISNIEFTGYGAPLEVRGNGHRLAGNYLHDGIASEDAVIGITGTSSGLRIYGNYMRDNGTPEDGHGFYIQGFGTNQDIDFGWNQIKNQRGRRAIQLFGHQTGDRITNVNIHDNLITGSIRNNILLGGSDGGNEILGTIYVRNNIIADADDQGLRINDSQGTVYVQNNTFYGNGASGYDGNAQIYIERAGAGRITVQNNILYAGAGETYYQLEPGLSPSVLKANNNLVFNAGSCAAWDTGCVNLNPLFINAAGGDFRLSAGSPAINAGIAGAASGDYVGVSRPQGIAPDIGAFEFLP